MKARTLSVIIAFLVIISIFISYHVGMLTPSPTPSHENYLKMAANFLKSVQFNPALNLCREAPRVAPNKYWLVSDNLLAYHALEPYYPDIAGAIRNKMEEYGYFRSYCHEVMFGEALPYVPFRTVNRYLIEQGQGYEIWTEVYNGSGVMSDYMEYANLCLYAALHYHCVGEGDEAIQHFNHAKNMWDGKGMNDKAYRESEEKLYETYKLALLLYVSRVMNQTLEFKEEVEEVLWLMQDANGGIHTHYNADLNYEMSDVNTETTSITIIAYKYAPALLDP